MTDVVLGTTVVGGDPSYVEWTSPEGAGYLDATFQIDPPRQSISVVLREGGEDSRRVADSGGLINDGTLPLRATVGGDTTYTFEFSGFNNAETEIRGELRSLKWVDRPDGPFGMYRCDLAAVGNEVVSTQTPREALYYLGTTLQDDAQPTDPWYESLSGTSMSCPVTVGCCSLAAQAYRNEAGFFPKPLDLINIMEATAEGGSEAELAPHTEANAGAGFVDAVAAIELAQELGTAVAAQDDPSSGDPTEPEHPQLWEEIELCRFGQGQSLR